MDASKALFDALKSTTLHLFSVRLGFQFFVNVSCCVRLWRLEKLERPLRKVLMLNGIFHGCVCDDRFLLKDATILERVLSYSRYGFHVFLSSIALSCSWGSDFNSDTALFTNWKNFSIVPYDRWSWIDLVSTEDIASFRRLCFHYSMMR